jgi:hypothetical protein
MTDLCRELVQWVGIYGVDSEGVVSVDGSETGRDWIVSWVSFLLQVRPGMYKTRDGDKLARPDKSVSLASRVYALVRVRVLSTFQPCSS